MEKRILALITGGRDCSIFSSLSRVKQSSQSHHEKTTSSCGYIPYLHARRAAALVEVDFEATQEVPGPLHGVRAESDRERKGAREQMLLHT